MNEKELKELLERLEPVIELYATINGSDECDVICDMVADLAHWADSKDINFTAETRRAWKHYQAEIMELKHGTDCD